MDDYKTVREVYNKVSRIELGYRGLEKRPSDCLKDTIDSCICIMGRGSVRPEEYMNFSSGIGAIQGHIFVGRINGENAGVYASEVMYLAANILTGQNEYERDENTPLNQGFLPILKLKFVLCHLLFLLYYVSVVSCHSLFPKF